MNDWTNWRWNSRKPTQQRRRGHQGRGGDDRPVDPLVGRREHLQADRQRPGLDRVGDDQRPEEVVPVVAHRDQRVGEVDRPRQRHVDLEQHLQRARALDPRRVDELFRHRLECLAQQEDAERRGEVRQADGDDRVAQAERVHGPVVLDDEHVGHHHQLQQDQHEDEVAAGKLEPRQRVGRERSEHELRRQYHRHQQRRVEEVASEGRGIPGVGEVLQRQRRAELEAGRERRRMECGPDRVGERQDPQQAEQPGGSGLQHARRRGGAKDRRRRRHW